MEKINYTKVICVTLMKIGLMVLVFFTLNNWPNIKQSFGGEVPQFHVWLDHGFTLSNLILICLLSVVFFFNTYKKHKELAEKRANYTEL
ncbi:hypothetical protein [Pedobacter sp. UC225_65]|uniref:hypothetical protein n=1 Tax=Pedobacter sp. UC225_65 TaxID=3350173 RepID=UPI00366F0ED4